MIGFVLVDKPVGPSSHDMVSAVRRALGIKRVGHAGTLDPPASGLLVIGVGPATRLLSYIQGLPKSYEATGVLGVRTSTLDAGGDVVSRSDVNVTPEQVRDAADGFVGEIAQVPPAVSAVKVAGQRAYKRARRGEEVELEARPVTVYELDILRTSSTSFDARIRCSSGTYVRSLVADIGEKLGCGAHVAHLRRTGIGHLDVRDAVTPDAIEMSSVRPVETVLTHMPSARVDADSAALARNGRPLAIDAPEGDVLVCGPEGAVGVFRRRDGILRPVTVLGR